MSFYPLCTSPYVAQLKELGRKYRGMSEESKRELEELQTEHAEVKKTLETLRAENSELKGKLEEAPPTSGVSTDTADSGTQELEASKARVTALETTLHEKEARIVKLVRTVKAARARIDTMRTETEQVCMCVHVCVYAYDIHAVLLRNL